MCNITYCKDKFGTPEERKGISFEHASIISVYSMKENDLSFFNVKLCNLLRGTVKKEIKEKPTNTALKSTHTATYFDPIGSSSGWLLKLVQRSILIAFWK
jgi:hypothetical protein